MKIVVSKVDVVRRQLSAAVRMLFGGEDAVPIHTVISAGFRVARDLAKHRKAQVHEIVEGNLKPGMSGAFWKAFNRPANFFKHADDDPESVLDSVDEDANDFMLFLAISYFRELNEALSVEMDAYTAWFITSHPQFFPAEMVKVLESGGMGDFHKKSRQERLEHGHLAIEVSKELRASPSDA